jgi:hypothetical protein
MHTTTPTVPHPKLLLLFFLPKTEKPSPTISSFQIAIYPKLGKIDSTHAHMRAAIRGTSFHIRRCERV